MNATSTADHRPEPHEPGVPAVQHPVGPGSVPGQNSSDPDAEQLRGFTTDLLEHPDPYTTAQAASVENLLRCWVRENNLTAPERGILRIPLESTGTALLVPVHYWSATGWHRLGPPVLEDGPPAAPPVDAVTLAALLAREAGREGDTRATATARRPGADGKDDTMAAGRRPGTSPTTPTAVTPTATSAGAGPLGVRTAGTAGHAAIRVVNTRAMPAGTADSSRVAVQDAAFGGHDLVTRVADSLRRTVVFVAERRRHPDHHPDPFLAAEQSLLLGHPLHPTPKSREGLSDAETRLYSPELRGSFSLHWLAVHESVLAQDSAWTERGRTVRAEHIVRRLAGTDLPLPDGFAALPTHPWQTREIIRRPETARLLDEGLLRPLGPHGDAWHPTSSVRTLYRPGAPAMLKLSLGLRITNSRRENLRKELHRGVEVHRLLRTGLGELWSAVHPEFDIVRDPAWLAVDGPDGEPVPGIDVMIRHNPFGPNDNAVCVAGLVSPAPHPDVPVTAGHHRQEHIPMRSRLAETVARLAGRTGRPRGAVAAEWFLRYLERVVRPVLWLDGEAGVALEAHQQNTVLLLDTDGWPVGGRYRDNQGYYFRASRQADLHRRLPGLGEYSDTFVSDEVTDERFAYYLGINNVLGLIGAFGSQRLADEELLLAAFRRFLANTAARPGKPGSTMPALLLDSPVLRCKANLLTRLHGLDELVGPVDTQSVYVNITNPLHHCRT